MFGNILDSALNEVPSYFDLMPYFNVLLEYVPQRELVEGVFNRALLDY